MRRSEIVLAAYFAYTAVLALVLPVRPHIAAVTVLLNLCILAGYALLLYAWSLRHSDFLDIIRDWFPLPLTLLAYRQMGWFAAPHVSFRLENMFVQWDRVLLRQWGLHRAIESSGEVLPSILEIAYTLTYELAPFAVAIIYIYRRRERVERFMFPFVLAVLLCYAQFPFWPSEPPRAVFPGEDFPSVITVFRRLNWSMLGSYGIHTSVFPSAHVAGAFSTAFAMIYTLPEHRWVGRLLLVIAILIATATVYGRYHYAADAVAGFAMAVLAFGISRFFRPENLQSADAEVRGQRV
jgi:membrane-associated phospholipid phosphatase